MATLDHVIQNGIWVGSAAQIQTMDQAVRDANFEDFGTIEQYLEQIEASHVDADNDMDRGPIDPIAWERLESSLRAAWDTVHAGSAL